MDNFTELAVSDAGPQHCVMVYQRITGNVIWLQPWWMPYFWAKRRAARIVAEGLKFQ